MCSGAEERWSGAFPWCRRPSRQQAKEPIHQHPALWVIAAKHHGSRWLIIVIWRSFNVPADDFSRVKLISMHDDEGSDYINANFVPVSVTSSQPPAFTTFTLSNVTCCYSCVQGYKHANEYIATQGPLPETRNDFWKMVLQQKSAIVVMLTQCNERRRVSFTRSTAGSTAVH